MPKSIGLKNLDFHNREQLVAHLKCLRSNRGNSMDAYASSRASMNANVQAVLIVLEDIYLRK